MWTPASARASEKEREREGHDNLSCVTCLVWRHQVKQFDHQNWGYQVDQAGLAWKFPPFQSASTCACPPGGGGVGPKGIFLSFYDGGYCGGVLQTVSPPLT